MVVESRSGNTVASIGHPEHTALQRRLKDFACRCSGSHISKASCCTCCGEDKMTGQFTYRCSPRQSRRCRSTGQAHETARASLRGLSVATSAVRCICGNLLTLTITSHACSAPRRVSLNVLASITGLAAGPPGPPPSQMRKLRNVCATVQAWRRCCRRRRCASLPQTQLPCAGPSRDSEHGHTQEGVRVPNARMSRIYACLPDEDRVWDLAFTLLKLQKLESQPFSLP